jgi:protoporphyrinogen oxidase
MLTFLLCEKKILSSNEITSNKRNKRYKMQSKTILDQSNQPLLTHLQVTQRPSNTRHTKS